MDGVSVAVASKCGNNPAMCLALMFGGRAADPTDRYRETTKQALSTAGFIVIENGGLVIGYGSEERYPEPHASVTHPSQTYRPNGTPQWSNAIKRAFNTAFSSDKPVL
ncbi:MAG: hypothetical protein K8I60_16210 [Anaerolineae bacterium]|nr:hypothetical protein [Anaerolineae bacterium]